MFDIDSVDRNIEMFVFDVFIAIQKIKDVSDVIVANRFSDDLKNVEAKVYTRDIFGSDS